MAIRDSIAEAVARMLDPAKRHPANYTERIGDLMVVHSYHINPKVMGFFGGDYGRAKEWYETANPQLGGISPVKIIEAGRQERLDGWINGQAQLSGATP